MTDSRIEQCVQQFNECFEFMKEDTDRLSAHTMRDKSFNCYLNTYSAVLGSGYLGFSIHMHETSIYQQNVHTMREIMLLLRIPLSAEHIDVFEMHLGRRLVDSWNQKKESEYMD